MKKNKIIYWITTGLFSLMMLNSAFQYLISPDMEAAFDHLGFPAYFRIELAVAKFLGVIALLLPIVPRGFKHFAYAGFTIVLFSAGIAHASVGDPPIGTILPFVLFGVLAASYTYYEKLKKSRNILVSE